MIASSFFFSWLGRDIPNHSEFRCERDELADLVEDFKHAGVIGSHWRGLTLYKMSFSGSQLVDWLHKEKGMGKCSYEKPPQPRVSGERVPALNCSRFVPAREDARNTGVALLQKKYMVGVHGGGLKGSSFGTDKDATETLYRLLEDDPHSSLNAGRTASCNPIRGRSGVDGGGHPLLTSQTHADLHPSTLSNQVLSGC